MKAKPYKEIKTETGSVGSVPCQPDEATHVWIRMPGPTKNLILPVVLKNATRAGTGCWSWNGDVDRPTLKPSILSHGTNEDGTPWRCHSFVNDGVVQFLEDCSHELGGHSVPMPEHEPDPAP